MKSRHARSYAALAYEWLTTHPENHDQEFYYIGPPQSVVEEVKCGTTMCVAGFLNLAKNGKAAGNVEAYAEGKRILELDGAESEALFMEMNEARALEKLKKIADGVEWDRDDYKALEVSLRDFEEGGSYEGDDPDDYIKDYWDLRETR